MVDVVWPRRWPAWPAWLYDYLVINAGFIIANKISGVDQLGVFFLIYIGEEKNTSLNSGIIRLLAYAFAPFYSLAMYLLAMLMESARKSVPEMEGKIKERYEALDERSKGIFYWGLIVKQDISRSMAYLVFVASVILALLLLPNKEFMIMSVKRCRGGFCLTIIWMLKAT